MKVIFLRHGATPGNLEKRYVGRTDEPLSEEGRAELKALLKDDGFARKIGKVFVSPYKRCKETAEIFFPDAEQCAVYDLREMDFGIFEYKNYIDLEHSKEYDSWVKSRCEDPIPEGESKESFTDRTCKAFLEVMGNLAETETEPIVFVVHGGTIMSVFSVFAAPEREYYEWYAKNGRGYAADWDGKKLTSIEAI